MKILYIGDIMGEPGIKTVAKVLPEIKKQHQPDLIIAQAENVSEGKGMTVADYGRLKEIGVQVFTGGNHTMAREETSTLLEDENISVTRPANYPEGTAGKPYKVIDTKQGKVLVVTLLGSVVGKSADEDKDNPLSVIDKVLSLLVDDEFAAIVVNFHGDYSSEKVMIAHYLDGRVTAVIGDHWHIPTADARILPGGTAHITDVGMCGSLDSSLGVRFESTIPRWRDGIVTKNELETEGPMQFNAVIVEAANSRATSITLLRQIIQ